MGHERKIKLSICIPVYNQIILLEKCVKTILQYIGDDIEVIIQDNCSDDEIASLVSSIADDRVKYYRNGFNMGHDMNIIQSFKNASSDFCFLLRTRDCLIPEAIPLIIKTITDNPNTSYIAGDAIYPDGSLRLKYSTEHFSIGSKAVSANHRLYIHPSGSIYNVSLLDLDLIEQFLLTNTTSSSSFITHVLFRTKLAEVGDFRMILSPIWIYALTIAATDIAVTSVRTGESPNCAHLVAERLRLFLIYVSSNCNKQFFETNALYFFRLCLTSCTWIDKHNTKIPAYVNHYNISVTNNSILSSRRTILDVLHNFRKDYSVEFTSSFKIRYAFIVINNCLFSPFYYLYMRTAFTLKERLKTTSIYPKVLSIYAKLSALARKV